MKKIPADQAKSKKSKGPDNKKQSSSANKKPSIDIKDLLSKLSESKGSLSAKLLDSEGGEVADVEIKDLINTLGNVKPDSIILDGIITQRLVDAAHKASVKTLVGVNKAADIKNTYNINILTEHKS